MQGLGLGVFWRLAKALSLPLAFPRPLRGDNRTRLPAPYGEHNKIDSHDVETDSYN